MPSSYCYWFLKSAELKALSENINEWKETFWTLVNSEIQLEFVSTTHNDTYKGALLLSRQTYKGALLLSHQATLDLLQPHGL